MAAEMDRFRNFPFEGRSFWDMTRPYGRFFEDYPYQQFSELTPRMDVQETDTHYIVAAELPGVPKNKIDIETEGNRLRICAEKSSSYKRKHEQGEGFARYEQIVTLPEATDPAQIETEYEDGILYLAIPKSQMVKKKKLEVGAGQKGVLSKLKEKVAEAIGIEPEDSKAKRPEKAA